MSILELLASNEDGLSAAQIGAALGLSHEATYLALVQLETRGAVRVVVDFAGQRLRSPIARWELMTAGMRMLTTGEPA